MQDSNSQSIGNKYRRQKKTFIDTLESNQPTAECGIFYKTTDFRDKG